MSYITSCSETFVHTPSQKFLFITVFFFFTITLNANTIDSLATDLNNCEVDTCRFDFNYKLAKSYLSINIDSSLWYTEQSYTVAEKLKDEKRICFANFMKATIYANQRKLELSDSIYDVLKRNSFLRQSEYLQGILNGSLAGFYYKTERYDSAGIYFQKGMNSLKENDPDFVTAKVKYLSNLGLVESHRKNYSASLNYLKEALSIIEKAKEVKNEKSIIYKRIGNIYKKTKDYKSAVSFYRHAIESANEYPSTKFTAMYSLANVYQLTEQYDSLKHISDILIAQKKGIRKSTETLSLGLVVKYFIHKNQIDSAQFYNNAFYQKITQYKFNKYLRDYYENAGIIFEHKGLLNKALESYQKVKILEEKEGIKYINKYISTIEAMIRINLGLKKNKDAKELLQLYSLYQDSFNLFIIDEELQKWHVKYKTQQKEDSIQIIQQKILYQDLQNQNLRQKNNFILAIFLFLICSLIYALFSYKKEIRFKEKYNNLLEKKNENIILLNQELNHRVKNTLQYIVGLFRFQTQKMEEGQVKKKLIESGHRVEAISLVYQKLQQENQNDTKIRLDKYLEELSKKLEYTYSNDNRPLIIKTNFDKMETEINTATYLGLIINELVTNFVKYGLKAQPTPKINMSITQHLKGYTLQVVDNGNGNPDDILKNDKQSFGIKLIQILTEQLNGNLIVKKEKKGLAFQFIFE